MVYTKNFAVKPTFDDKNNTMLVEKTDMVMIWCSHVVNNVIVRAHAIITNRRNRTMVSAAQSMYISTSEKVISLYIGRVCASSVESMSMNL